MLHYKLCKIYKGAPRKQKPSLKNDWYVYYCFNKFFDQPEMKPKFERFPAKLGINRETTIAARLEKANDIKHDLDDLLKKGFNPYVDSNTNAKNLAKNEGYTKLKDALEWVHSEKCKKWSKGTKKDYKSILSYFMQIVEKRNMTYVNVRSITRVIMRSILGEMVETKGLGDHAYLKYKGFMYNYFEFLKDWEKIDYNPCDFKAPVRKPKPKKVIPLSNEQRKAVKEQILKHSPGFYNYLMVLFYCHIRPKEIFYLRVGDINLEKHEIIITADGSKNSEDRKAIIPKMLDPYLLSMNLHKYPSHYFVFGHDFTPQERSEAVPRDRSTKLWNMLIKDSKTGLGINSNQYWLKHQATDEKRDAGIEAEAAQFQSGHADYKTTQEHYSNLDRPGIREQLREKTKGFIEDEK